MFENIIALRWYTPFLALLPLTLAAPVAAENKAAAQVLFDAARDAMDAEDYDLACSKFDESNRLDPAVGTLLNLGNCEELRGHLAGAWRRYTEALDMLEPDDRRYIFAHAKAEALEPRVPRLTLNLENNSPSDTFIRLNRERVSELGVPVRLDPGEYTVVVEAEGYEGTTNRVELGEGDRQVLTLGPGPKVEEELPPAPPPVVVDTATDDRKTIGYVAGGVGVATGVAAITFGVLTYRNYEIAKDHCDLETNTCFDSEGLDAARTGGNFELLAYSLGIVSAASLVTGWYFLLYENDDTAARVEAGDFGGIRGLRVTGEF